MPVEPSASVSADAPWPESAQPSVAPVAKPQGRVRWTICALLFAAATVNYLDRQVLSVLKGTLSSELGWNELDYGNVVTAFQGAYALGMLVMGRLVDSLGTRRGFSVAVGFWSLAAMAHGLASSTFGFACARFALGFGEAGMFPGAVKSIAEWFPKRERALATGIFNSGTNVGAILCPLLVPIVVSVWGYRAAFAITGSAGLLWLVVWLVFYRPPAQHPKLTRSEREYIESEPAPPAMRLGFRQLLPHRQAWAFAGGKFLTDPFWWLYLFWIPDFLQRTYGLKLLQVGPPLVAIYVMSDLGSIAGGWLSSRWIARGVPVNRARKGAMLVCALGVVPILLATHVSSLWSAVALVGLATAAHQGFSANLFTLTSDLFPTRAVGSVVGFGGMAGALGGMLLAQIAGHVLHWTGSYTWLFAAAACAYFAAVLWIHWLSPDLRPAALATHGESSP
jgi:MFS transporter, ACS family, hexuronate transporter